MSYQSTADLKSIARDKMLGNYGTAIGAFLFMRFLIMTGMMLATFLVGSNFVISLAISFALLLFEGIFVYGELAIYLKISVGMKTDVTDIFSAFKGAADRAIRARLIYMGILYGGLLLGSGIEYILRKMQLSGVVMMAIVWGIVAVICVYLLLTYSQVMYYLQDFSDITVLEAARRSRTLMNGNKLTLFGMYMSFVPLYVVGVLSMMVGMYFIHPYVKMTFTEFYLDRVRQTQSPSNTSSFDVSV